MKRTFKNMIIGSNINIFFILLYKKTCTSALILISIHLSPPVLIGNLRCIANRNYTWQRAVYNIRHIHYGNIRQRIGVCLFQSVLYTLFFFRIILCILFV